MDRDFWLSRWEAGEIGFHQAEVNPYLQQFWQRLDVPLGAPVFVPLCGKSLDMAWLLSQGHPVLGVELSTRAVEQFFREHDLHPMRTPAEVGVRYQANDVVIIAGDFFSLSPGEVEGIGAVYDRASLIALPRRMREHYAERLTSLVPTGVPMLLVALEYPQDQMSGPPFSVSEEEVRQLYEGEFQVERLLAEDVLDAHPRFRQRGLRALTEKVYALWR
jgi:thiopurine S-methyltransferase